MDIRNAFKSIPNESSSRKRKSSGDNSAASDAKLCKTEDCTVETEVIESTKCLKAVSENNIPNLDVDKVVSSTPTKATLNGHLSDSTSSSTPDEKLDISKLENEQDKQNSMVVSSDDDHTGDDHSVSLLNSSTANVSLSMSELSAEEISPSKNELSNSKDDAEAEQESNKCNQLSPSCIASTSNSTVTPSSKLLRKRKRMTPDEAKLKAELRTKQQQEREQKQKERLAKLEERRLLKEQREQQRKEAMEERQRKKELEETERKEREKLKQEKKEQEEKEKQRKNQEKEEKNKAKAEEKKKKEEQKLKVLEEKLKVLDEKRKAEEEKQKLKMEEERKKAKTKEAFENFFKKRGNTSSPPQSQSKEGVSVNFLPFQVAEDMVLAPSVPSVAQARFNRKQLDDAIVTQKSDVLFLDQLKSKDYHHIKHKKSKKSPSEEEVIIVSDAEEAGLNLKAKLLQFCDNIRPAYWGTWRKISKHVRPRKPFAKDETVFDYEVDSEEEWDEGGPGESLSGTEDEHESEDDYEVDNQFLVPHGYLSAEEEGDDEECELPDDPQARHERLKMKEREFLSERSKKTKELKPVIVGCFFEVDGCGDQSIWKRSLLEAQAEILTKVEIPTFLTVSRLTQNDSLPNSTATSPTLDSKSVKRPVPEEAMPYLIRLLHANTNGRHSVVKEFQEFWSRHCKNNSSSDVELKENQTPSITNQNLDCSAITSSPICSQNGNYKISKRQLDMTIQKIASWCKCPNAAMKKFCWWVKDEILEKYGVVDIPVPNNWDYTTKMK